MKILLINIDSKIPNLALHEIAKYYSDKGDEIIWDMPLIKSVADKIFVSCVFSWNHNKCREWKGIAEIGGSGYDLSKTLPDEIDNVKPHINLGFTTRGCIRKCTFCIVPMKEGSIRIVGDLLDLWDGISRDVVILDNNILAVPDHFEKICLQAQQYKIRLDYNQGLDHRLLTKEIVRILKATPHKEYRFSFDHPSYYPTVERALSLLRAGGIKRAMWYVLIGYDTNFREDLERLNFLRDQDQDVFVQRYNYTRDKQYINLARWANQHHVFRKMNYNQFLSRQ